MNVGYCVSCRKRLAKPDGVTTAVRCNQCHKNELLVVERLARRLGYAPQKVVVRERNVIQINEDIYLHDLEDLEFYGREQDNAEAA